MIPVSIALVATSYQGIARATAIGLAYGAYGAAGGVAPILLQIVPDQRAPAFVAAIVACAIAIALTRNRISEMARPSAPERPYVVGTAIWAFGIVTLTVGVTWLGGGLGNPIRWVLVLTGLGVLGLAMVHDRRRIQGRTGLVRIERRPVAVAIFVGIVLAVSQTVPMMALPLYFHLVRGYGPLLATVALGPLFIALIAAGPIAGFLLTRYSPRSLVGIGVVAVGLANLLLWWVATPSSTYLAFLVPCFLVGAGFVIATTVRTAIIFASVPRGLPATAAALNESSIAVGTRVGIVFVTTSWPRPPSRPTPRRSPRFLPRRPSAPSRPSVTSSSRWGHPRSARSPRPSPRRMSGRTWMHTSPVYARRSGSAASSPSPAGRSRGSLSAAAIPSRPCTSIATNARRSRADDT